jgi:hypothetical protein
VRWWASVEGNPTLHNRRKTWWCVYLKDPVVNVGFAASISVSPLTAAGRFWLVAELISQAVSRHSDC